MTSKKIYVNVSPTKKDTCVKIMLSASTQKVVDRVEIKVAKLEKAKKRN
jgi:hypothetical protein